MAAAKSLDELAADGRIDPGWARALAPVGRSRLPPER
jgi:hypothetical protein